MLITGAVLLVIAALAAVLRFYRLDGQSLWYDEGFSVYLGQMGLGEITSRTAADIQPPFYYYLVHFWMQLFGHSEWALRGLSALFGVLTVPLIYAAAWELFRCRLAGVLSAFLLAISPLHVWYGQEIRMYTLLTLLCLLSSYLLLLLARDSMATSQELRRKVRWREVLLWAGFTLATIVALYTHYFAIFILCFQAIYLLAVWWGKELRPWRLLLGGGISLVLIGLAYLPWLPHLVTRYGADMSYWSGNLKIPEVLVDIVVFYAGGEAVPEPVGIALSVVLGLIALVCLCALAAVEWRGYRRDGAPGAPGESRPEGDEDGSLPEGGSLAAPADCAPYPTLFLLLYFFLPPLLILILSYGSPKFNARYVMVSHPALLLLVGGGLAALWSGSRGRVSILLKRGLVVASLIFMIGVALYANHGAYSDPTFNRADYRGAARYIRNNMADDEVVILASGHMFPVFDYYAPGVERYLLPDSPTLDTTRTLDYSIAGQLNDWLAGKGGVWLVLWQDEIVDPAGYLTTMLDQAGDEEYVRRDFPQLEVKHYRLDPDVEFSEQPGIAHPTVFNFGNLLKLHGYTQSGGREATLYWEALQPLADDYRVSLVLRDTGGQSWGKLDSRPSAYLFPTDRWPVGRIVPGRYELLPVPGTPPGDYGIEVGVYTESEPVGVDILDPAGAPQGKRAMLGAVALSVEPAAPGSLDVPMPLEAELGGGLSLAGWDLEGVPAQPGDQLLLTILWEASSRPQTDFSVRLEVTDATGATLDAGTFPPTNAWHPTSNWLEGQAWRGQSTFRLPIDAQPGPARLAVQLVDRHGLEIGFPVDLGGFEVLETTRGFTAPQPQVERPANFGNRIGLLGADLASDTALEVTLYWQGLRDMDVPYTVFVHLLGSDGAVVTGHDGQPAGAARPTTGWIPGEYISDPHRIDIPGNLEPGFYVIEAGLYDPAVPGMPRLPILDDAGNVVADRVIFGPVEILGE